MSTAFAPAPAPAATATPRRWIISNDYRRCYCSGAARTKVEISPDGAIRVTCRKCGKVGEGQAYSYKERRPCKRCDWERDVTVKLFSQGVGQPPKEYAEEHCGICLLEISASRHARTAAEFRERAARLRAERAQKSA